MIDRTEFPEATPAASRRVFHSKVDTIRPTYGFEDVSLAPGTDTVEPADVDLTQTFCGIRLEIPILASAMDAVVDTRMAGELARLGGLAVLNLEGVQTRYDDPDAILERIATAPDGDVQEILAEVYQQPIREDLIAARLETIHAAGSKAAVAATPGAAMALAVSMPAISAWACGLRSRQAWSWPGRLMSSVYLPLPVRKRRSSLRRTDAPMPKLPMIRPSG